MSSPTKSENKDPSFPAEDIGQQQRQEDQNLHQSSSPHYSAQSPKLVTLKIPDADKLDSPPYSTLSRRVGGRRKKRNIAQEKKLQKKLEVLTGTLNLIPFVPVKTLDLSSHEALLRRLGLWDFAHLNFDFKIRHDLILQLIASFSPSVRASKVNEVRIKVTRPDLARALCLPVKKDKVDNALEVKENEESVSFIEEFVSTFLLLHEDAWMMPDDILNTIEMIKEGNFEKVDFATLIWLMVEKELTNSELRKCYYASHLQLLIKYQRENFFKEQEPIKIGIYHKEDEEEEEEVAKMSEELPGESELEEHNIELSLGGPDNAVTEDDIKERKELPNDDDDAMDFEESKEDEQGKWLNNSMDSHFLQRCNLGEVSSVECEEERKQEEEEEKEDYHNDEEKEDGREEEDGKEGEYEEKEAEMDFSISPKDVALEGLNSEHLIAAIEASPNPFSSGMQNRDNVSSVDFLGLRVDTVQTMPGGSSLLDNGNGSKRVIGHLENDMPSHSPHGGNKRMRSDGHWDDLNPASEFDVYMEQMQHVMGKIQMLYEVKEQAFQDLSMQNQMLRNELEQRTNMVHNLNKARMEEQQKRQMETYRLEHELYMMGNLLEGYRKALKDTSGAFSEYRKKCPMPEEPIYKDTRSRDLVLRITELEKQRLKQEEEERQNCLLIEKKIKEFEAGCITKFAEYKSAAELLGNRLLDLEKEVKFCKGLKARRCQSVLHLKNKLLNNL